MPVEHVRVSSQAREQLIQLKRRTGIQNWNALCRWALCLSLAEPSIPPSSAFSPAHGVEMTWRTFAGEYEDLYWALIRQRCHRDGLSTDEATVATQFRLHLHRGLGYLFGDKELRSISDLIDRVA